MDPFIALSVLRYSVLRYSRTGTPVQALGTRYSVAFFAENGTMVSVDGRSLPRPRIFLEGNIF